MLVPFEARRVQDGAASDRQDAEVRKKKERMTPMGLHSKSQNLQTNT